MAKKNVVKKVDLAANLAMYLLDKTGSVQGTEYVGEGLNQEEVFGRKVYTGKAWINFVIRGNKETIRITHGGRFGRGIATLFDGTWTECQVWLDAMN